MGVVDRLRSWARRRLSGPTTFVASFLLLIAIGTLGLLFLPGLYTNERLDFVGALFTATSAVCVTGLIVVDTATYFTFWGQLWILVLIQLGGIGLLTFAAIIMGVLGARLSLRTEAVAVLSPTAGPRLEVWQIGWSVVRFTLWVEAIGAAVLFVLLLPGQAPWPEALWHAVFQSISAFCNAGFSTYSDSLIGWSHSPVALAVTSALIIIGGLGYAVLRELWMDRVAKFQGRPSRISTNTFAALVTTGLLLVAGTGAYAILEWHGELAPFGTLDRLSNAWFMSATARTAGFNTIDYSRIGNDSALITILLMFVGGSPGSTAGGIKTTTLAVLLALAVSRMRGRRFVALHDRGVPADTIERAVSLTMLSAAVLTIAVVGLNVFHGHGSTPQAERADFLILLFESVSAFATVGLSMGATGKHGTSGDLITIALMFIGRVGLFSFFAAMMLRRAKPRAKIRLAEEDLFVG